MTDKIIALRMERQHLLCKVDESEYIELYRDLQPGYNVYWNGFGNPPTVTYRANFDDMAFNRKRQFERQLLKVRLIGGNIGWIMPEDLECFAGLYLKPIKQLSEVQRILLDWIEHEGALTIQEMKELTGLLVKEITPALKRLQEAFLIYEDQNAGQDDRKWFLFKVMFPNVSLSRYTKVDALEVLVKRFAYRMVWFDASLAKSYFNVPMKSVQTAIDHLVSKNVLAVYEKGYVLKSDLSVLKSYSASQSKSVYAMHRNDFLVRTFEPMLKEKYPHSYPDTLYYLLIDGNWRGVVVGKFRYTPEVMDVLLDDEKTVYKNEIIASIKHLSGQVPEKWCGKTL